MSIRCYFRKKPANWYLSGNGTMEMYLGEHLQRDPLGYYVLTRSHPLELYAPPKDDIEFYTLEDCHEISSSNSNLREPGAYRLGHARVILGTRQQNGQRQDYIQKISGRSHNWEDLRELAIRIRAGTIRPEVAYDTKQVLPLPYQFYDWLIAGIRMMKRHFSTRSKSLSN